MQHIPPKNQTEAVGAQQTSKNKCIKQQLDQQQHNKYQTTESAKVITTRKGKVATFNKSSYS